MTPARELPLFVRDMLASPPRAGDGVNRYLYSLARVLHPYRGESDILDTLRAVIANCGRIVSEQEIRRAVENSKAAAWVPGSRNPERATPAWPTINVEQREAVIAGMGMGLVDLWEVSPVRFRDNDSHCEEIIDTLFPDNPLLCCGKSCFHFATRSREHWRGELGGMQFIVPSPMTSRTGRTQDGKVSEHTLENTGPRRYLVVEQDQGQLMSRPRLLSISRSSPHWRLSCIAGVNRFMAGFTVRGNRKNNSCGLCASSLNWVQTGQHGYEASL